MAYAPLNWQEGVTKLGPTNLNHLEQGVASADADATQALADAAAASASAAAAQADADAAQTDADTAQTVASAAIEKALLTTTGDTIYASAASTPARQPIGSAGDVWTVVAGLPAWVAPAAAGSSAGEELAHAQITATVTAINNTTEATAHVLVTAPALVCDGTTAILIEFFAPGASHSQATGRMWFILYDSLAAASIGQMAVRQQGAAANDPDGPLYLARRFTPAAGTRTFSVRAFSSGTSGLVNAGAGGSGQTMPAFIRITRI